MNSLRLPMLLLSGSLIFWVSKSFKNDSLARWFPPFWRASTSCVLNVDMETDFTRCVNSRWMPLQETQTKVQKLVHTYCGPSPLQLTHLRLGGSLRSPRTIRSFLSSSFLDAAAIAHYQSGHSTAPPLPNRARRPAGELRAISASEEWTPESEGAGRSREMGAVLL